MMLQSTMPPFDCQKPLSYQNGTGTYAVIRADGTLSGKRSDLGHSLDTDNTLDGKVGLVR